jgi:hypothetical protein
MKNIKISFVYLLILVGITSCEEVIELDLATTAPRVVIEGIITDQPGPYTVTIKKTADFYDRNNFPAGRGATVKITDSKGNTDTLTEVEDGVYQTNILEGIAGRTYNLTVDFEGETYTASSTIPAKEIKIDSLAYKFEEESVFYNEGYYVTPYFTDIAGERNYFRLNLFVNGAPYLHEVDGDFVEDNNFNLIDDKFFEGNQIDYEFYSALSAGDSIYVELHHLDEATYDYYTTLVEVINGGGMAPSNPITNLSNDALGYFGAFSIDSASTVIEAE